MQPNEANVAGRKKRRGAAMLVVAAMFVGIAWSVGLDVQDRFVKNEEQIGLSRYATGVDPYLTRAAAGDGLFMRFLGFGRHGDYATNYYFRANYILFPQRVLVGDPSLPINTPSQIFAANSLPDDDWLLGHHTPNVLTIYCREDLVQRAINFRYQIRRLPAATTR